MNRIYIFSCLFLFLLASIGCEKDDICADGNPTTPRLIIEFYDDLTPSVRKNVINLLAQGEGANTGLLFNSVSKIELPLKTNIDTTSYSLIINFNEQTNLPNENQDNLKIFYTREDIYISRACGFKTIFSLDNVTPFELTNPNGDNTNWIKEVEVVRNQINTEEDVHIKIYY